MNSDLSVALMGALLFLVLSSKYAFALVKKYAGLTDDMSTVARTVVFALLFTLVLRIL
jgi:hypothetical protein